MIWASVIAIPMAYGAANIYLDFFHDRLAAPGAIIAIAGLLGILLSWTIVSVHAMSVAKTNPVHALRCE